MKAYVSIFPSGKLVATLPGGKTLVSICEYEMLLKMVRAGATGLAVREHRWDANIFQLPTLVLDEPVAAEPTPVSEKKKGLARRLFLTLKNFVSHA